MMTTTEAAVKLGMSRRRVLALIKAGRLAATKMGRDWMLTDGDLEGLTLQRQGWPKGKPRKVQPAE